MTSIVPFSTTAKLYAIATSPAYSHSNWATLNWSGLCFIASPLSTQWTVTHRCHLERYPTGIWRSAGFFQGGIALFIGFVGISQDISDFNAMFGPSYFFARVWTTGIMNDLSSKVLAGCGRNPISQMAATGIPPTLVLANQMDMLSEKVTRLEPSRRICGNIVQ